MLFVFYAAGKKKKPDFKKKDAKTLGFTSFKRNLMKQFEPENES
jgi:hypothetical protein